MVRDCGRRMMGHVAEDTETNEDDEHECKIVVDAVFADDSKTDETCHGQ